MNTIHEILAKWNDSSDERQKMQHIYAFGGVIILVIAGLIGLVNYSLGQLLAVVALASIAIFFINGIVWALLLTFVLLRLDRRHYEQTAVKPVRKPVKK